MKNEETTKFFKNEVLGREFDKSLRRLDICNKLYNRGLIPEFAADYEMRRLTMRCLTLLSIEYGYPNLEGMLDAVSKKEGKGA